MNGSVTMTGLDGLFREHKRLANKLTSEELRAIQKFIESRLLNEQAELYFQLCALQNDHDLTLRRSSEAISNLHQELREKKEVLREYRDSDGTIANVRKQKEIRWEKKQELLLNEIDKGEKEYQELSRKLLQTKNALEESGKRVMELEEKMDTAEEAVQLVDEAKYVVQERETVRKEILKLKLEIDKRDRALAVADKEITSLKNARKRLIEEKQLTDVKVAGMQRELHKQMQDVAQKCSQITELEFLVQDEKRQVSESHRLLKKMKEEKSNYTRMLADSERAEFSNRERSELLVKKDLEVTEAKIRLLEMTYRVRHDDAQSVVDRIEKNRAQEKLANQIKNEVFLQGNTFLELTVFEMLKKIEEQKTRLAFELRRVRDIRDIKKDAHLLKTDINALKKQAEINMLVDLANKASKQIHRVDTGLRNFKEKCKHHVPLLTGTRAEQKKPEEPEEFKGHTFITSNSPEGGKEPQMAASLNRKTKLPNVKAIPSKDKQLSSSLDLSGITPARLDIALKSPPHTCRGKHKLTPLKAKIAKAVSYPQIPST